MAGSCSYGYQLWVHGNRDSGDYAKLSTKRSEKSIAVNVSINCGSADRHGICFFHSGYVAQWCVYCRNWYHVVYLDVSEGTIFGMKW